MSFLEQVWDLWKFSALKYYGENIYRDFCQNQFIFIHKCTRSSIQTTTGNNHGTVQQRHWNLFNSSFDVLSFIISIRSNNFNILLIGNFLKIFQIPSHFIFSSQYDNEILCRNVITFKLLIHWYRFLLIDGCRLN